MIVAAHVNDPKCWSANARPHCLLELYHNGGAMLITVVFVVFRRFQLLPAILFLLHQTGALLFCAMLQPNYDRRMNDFRTALFAYGTWTGLIFLILSFDGAHDPNSLFSKIMSVLLYVGFLPAIGGVFFSRYMWEKTTSEAWVKYEAEVEKDKKGTEGGADSEKADEISLVSDDEIKEDVDGKTTEMTNLALYDLNSLSDELWMPIKTVGHEGVSIHKSLVFPNKTKQDVPHIEEDTVWAWVKDFYIDGISMSLKEWYNAMRVEVSIRKLFWPRVPVTQDTRNKDRATDYEHEKRRNLDVAEHILKWGVMKHPQSTYLQLQLLGFRIYREQVDKKGLGLHNSADKTVYTQVVIRMEDIEKLGLTLDLQFALFRKRKDLEHLRDSVGDKDVNSVSAEEVKKRQRAAHHAHERTLTNIHNVWKALKQKRHVNSSDAMTTLLERVWESEQVATEAYEYIVDRLSVNGQDASGDALKAYAGFLRDVKNDRNAYNAMLSRSLMSSTSRDSTSHQSGSQASQTDATQNVAKENVVKEGLKKISNLKAQLRSATLLLMGCVTVLFVVYFILVSQYRDMLLNVNESGIRCYLSMKAVKLARDMDFSAYHFKTLVPDEVAAAESIECPREDIRCGIAVAKRYPLCTIDQLAYHNGHPGGPTLSWPADKICAPDVCCFHQFGPSREEPHWSASAFTAHEDLQYYHQKSFEEESKYLDSAMEEFKYFHNNLVKTYRTSFQQQDEFYDRVNDKIEVYIADPDPLLEIKKRSVKVAASAPSTLLPPASAGTASRLLEMAGLRWRVGWGVLPHRVLLAAIWWGCCTQADYDGSSCGEVSTRGFLGIQTK